MRKLNGRELKALFVLSIVVPVGLFATLRLTGILQEPPTLETITVEPVSWQMDRPSMTVGFVDERIENALTTDEASVGIGVQIATYCDDTSEEPFNGGDGVTFRVHVNTTMEPGFVASFAVRFYSIDSNAFVFISQYFLVNHNATVTLMKHIGTNTSEPYILATVVDSPCYLSTQVYWVFYDQNLEGHQLRVAFEFTYQNTSVYKTLVLPILLEMVQDIGNTFDTAKNVTAGEHRGCIDTIDYVDMYSVTLEEGQIININLTPPKTANYDLYLYNPNHDMVANSTQTENKPEYISHVVDETGTWYLKVYNQYWPSLMQGIYTLKVEVQTPLRNYYHALCWFCCFCR